MFGDKLTLANAKITALLGILATTGFKFNAEAIADPKAEASVIPSADAFKAHLDAQQTAAVTAATGPLTTKVGELTAANAGLSATVAAYSKGLAEAGVTLDAFTTADKAEGKTAEEKAAAAAAANVAAVKTAVETKVAMKSAKQIAGAGHPNALDVAPGNNDATSAAATPNNADEFKATLKTIKDPGERTAYFRKHKARFGL